MIIVICVNADHRPNDIPISKWVKLHHKYTITKIDFMNMQNRILGCQLEEIDLSNCLPYQYFRLDRFLPVTDAMADAINEQKAKLLTLCN